MKIILNILFAVFFNHHSCLAILDQNEFDDILNKLNVWNRSQPSEHATYKQLSSAFQQMNEDQKTIFIREAHWTGNPIFFEPAKNCPTADQFSINLLWLHKDVFIPQMGHHLMGTDDSALEERVLKPLFKWFKQNPDSPITYWYGNVYGDMSGDYQSDMVKTPSINSKTIFISMVLIVRPPKKFNLRR